MQGDGDLHHLRVRSSNGLHSRRPRGIFASSSDLCVVALVISEYAEKAESVCIRNASTTAPRVTVVVDRRLQGTRSRGGCAA